MTSHHRVPWRIFKLKLINHQTPLRPQRRYPYPGRKIFPLLVFQNFYIMFGPKNLERSIVDRLGQAFLKAAETPEFVQLAKKLDIYVEKPLLGSQLSERMLQRYKKAEELFKKVGM